MDDMEGEGREVRGGKVRGGKVRGGKVRGGKVRGGKVRGGKVRGGKVRGGYMVLIPRKVQTIQENLKLTIKEIPLAAIYQALGIFTVVR